MTRFKWECDRCGKAVADGAGYICIDHVAALGALHRRDEARQHERELAATQGGVVTLAQIDVIAPVRWGVLHHACDPQPDSDDYWFDVGRCRDLPSLLEWNAHLSEKNWIKATDWFRFIQRRLA